MMVKYQWRIALSLILCGYLCSEAASAEPLETTVAKEGFAATFYEATDRNREVGLIVLGGSEGGKPKHLASFFSAEGYAVMALGYFKVTGASDYLDEIPLEYFDKPIKWFADRMGMENRKIVLVGGSKGAELALLLAARRSDIGGVIAISPSSVVFQGLPKVYWPPRSSWSFEGKPVPFVPYDASRGVDPKRLLPLYQLSLTHQEFVKQAAIPVEKISGPILLLSGKEDQMWPAAEMADSIDERLSQHKFPHPFRNIQYEKAGHTLTEYFMIGGTEEGNRDARIDSSQKMLEFLETDMKAAGKESLR
ncbi:MAG: hypothetical protein KDA68_13785 [Planctomycetaceae bacterium]|nr:hypothetical protein [Planctomycetaceae bacterium]